MSSSVSGSLSGSLSGSIDGSVTVSMSGSISASRSWFCVDRDIGVDRVGGCDCCDVLVAGVLRSVLTT